MTPAIDVAKSSGIDYAIHMFSHEKANTAYGDEAAGQLAVVAEQIFKTIVCETQAGELVVGVLSVVTKLNLKAMASSVNTKKVALASKNKVQRTTGYVVGGISPLGQKNALKTIIDTSAQKFDTIYVSAGRRGLEIELKPSDLIMLTKAQLSSISA